MYLLLDSFLMQGATQIRVWARPDMMHAAEYAIEVAGPIMDWLEDYTGQEYPMEKIGEIFFKLLFGVP
jgi:aminopeptidase N